MGSSNSLASAQFGGFKGDLVSEELAAAWEADPRCVECGEAVQSVLEAALLVGLNRVAHKERCFIPALVRENPHLKLLTARGSARGTIDGERPPGAAQARGAGEETARPRSEGDG